jgi:acetoin utilization deacetylase AcuC-like enzyme
VTRIVSHADFAWRHPTGAHPERGERLAALHRAYPDFVEARPATVDELVACHEPSYVDHIAATSARGGDVYLDPDTICTPSSYETARVAAGAAIQAVEQQCFALVRPPGHHALPAQAMGFCLFGNAAVAARFAQRELGCSRVAILDWDVHHGNGTQAIFWDDPTVFFASLHQWPWWPGSGGPEEGNATTLNVPLRAGCGDEEYLDAMERVVEPAVAAFEPDLVVVSAGFDAAAGDPLGGMSLTPAGFGELARRASALSERNAFVLEGGYDVAALVACVGAVLDTL